MNKEIKFSDDVTERFISNPDVNHYDSYAMLSVGGKQQPCTMVICSDRDYAGGSFLIMCTSDWFRLTINFLR